MTTLFAQPYDLSVVGFYFQTKESYDRKAARTIDCMGLPVEEYEIHFIDGKTIDGVLFKTLRVNQTTFGAYLDACDAWGDDEKRKVIIAVSECGYGFDLGRDTPDGLDVDIYPVESLKELAEQFVDDGLFGEIPASIANYLDYEAIARDLEFDYTETTIAGDRLVYRCF